MDYILSRYILIMFFGYLARTEKLQFYFIDGVKSFVNCAGTVVIGGLLGYRAFIESVGAL